MSYQLHRKKHPLHGGQAQHGDLQCRPASVFKQPWLLQSPLGTCASSLCKLQLSAHLCSSSHMQGHHTEILLCWAAFFLLWRQFRCWEESCYASKPWEEPISHAQHLLMLKHLHFSLQQVSQNCALHRADIYDRELDTSSALRVPAHLTSAETDKSNFDQIPTWAEI